MSLPLHLGSIQPSMLVISFRRQSIALKLAHAHALMHANRPFLLAKLGPESKAQVDECIGAARSVMEIVDGFAIEGSLFHALWWTQYVTFCALVVFYVWDIRIKRRAATVPSPEQGRHSGFMKLAHRCQIRLAEATATNSPSRKYAVILEEFCSEAMGSGDIPKFSAGDRTGRQLQQPQPQLSQQTHGDANPVVEDSYRAPNDQGDTVLGGSGENGHFPAHSFLDQWDTNDWIDLDSSAFGPWMAEMDSQSLNWIPDMGV